MRKYVLLIIYILLIVFTLILTVGGLNITLELINSSDTMSNIIGIIIMSLIILGFILVIANLTGRIYNKLSNIFKK